MESHVAIGKAAATASSRGHLFVIAAPSGAGKTSLVKALMERETELQFSVSYTTRNPRPNERDGEDYHFVSAQTFQAMVANNEFLEHARVEWVVHSADHQRDQIRSMVEHDLWNQARAISKLLGGRQNLPAGLRGDARARPVRPRNRGLRDPREASDVD